MLSTRRGSLREVSGGVGGVSDYVVYWFRLAHDSLPPGGRAGLVGTNTIRQGDTRASGLDYIIDHGGVIVDAWSSIPWSGDAAVSVSIVNWVKDEYLSADRVLWLDEGDRKVVLNLITGSLAEELDLRSARQIKANRSPKIVFQGQTPGHDGFVLSQREARTLIASDPKSSSVVYPYIIGDDLLNADTARRWIIDFAQDEPLEAQAIAPGAFSQLERLVLPDRAARGLNESNANESVLASNPKARS